MPRSARISSAASVSGPLAASTTSFARTAGAFSDVTCSSIAAGTSRSHSTSRTAFGGSGSAPGNPTTDPVRSLWAPSGVGSSPSARKTPPRESETATMRAPVSWNRSAACRPAFPNPWIATVAPSSEPSPGTPPMSRKCSAASTAPWAVARARAARPPSETGLPVTTGRLGCPRCIIE